MASASFNMLLFASQTAPGGPTVILPALLITGLLVAASQAFVPKGCLQKKRGFSPAQCC